MRTGLPLRQTNGHACGLNCGQQVQLCVANYNRQNLLGIKSSVSINTGRTNNIRFARQIITHTAMLASRTYQAEALYPPPLMSGKAGTKFPAWVPGVEAIPQLSKRIIGQIINYRVQLCILLLAFSLHLAGLISHKC